MYDTSLMLSTNKYRFRKEILKYSHSTTNKRGETVFVFKNERGTFRKISQKLCQRELWEEIEVVPELQKLIVDSETSANKPQLLNPPQYL